jgi:hypothetical protein
MPESTRGGKICLLSRALYRVKLFDLAPVPARERRKVLRNLLLAWSPFDQSEFLVILTGERAVAFCWDEQRASEWLRTADTAVKACVPEGLFRPAHTEDGLRLVRCLEGFELQLWVAGIMEASRWWTHEPTHSEQVDFLRTLGNRGGEAALENMSSPDLPWRVKPWAETLTIDELASNWSRLEQLTMGVAAVGLSALTGAQAHQMFTAYDENKAIAQDLEKAKLTVAPVLSARDRALSEAAELDRLARQLTAAQPIEIMQHLTALLPTKGVVLKELELKESKLKLGVELAPDIQRSALVKDLQAGGWFVNVAEMREATARNWVSFEMTLASTLPPPASGKSAIAANRENGGGKP